MFTIHEEHCIKCDLCEEVCDADAIDFDQEPEIVEEKVGAIICAIGYDTCDPTEREEYGYGVYDNSITSIELERLINASGPTGGKVVRLSDRKKPKRIAFHSVRGRDPHRTNPYCSNV